MSGDYNVPALLSLWIVECTNANGERRVVLQSIAVKKDGTRAPTIEKKIEKYFQAPHAQPYFTVDERVALFAEYVEPTLQRELKHKGAASGDGSYSAELIGYLEIV